MKWFFLCGLIVFTAALLVYLRNNRAHIRYAISALGLMPFLEARFHIYAAPISWAGWAGPVQGIIVSLGDAVAISIILSTSKAKSPLSLRIALGLIFLALGVSTMTSGFHTESLFTSWEVLRALLVYLAVIRASASDKGAAVALMNGFITGLVIQAVTVASDFASGQAQSGAWFGHQNLLGFVSHFVVLPAFAAMLGGYYPKRMFLAVTCGLVIAFGGASRATIGLTIVGMAFTILFSVTHRTTGRKMAVIGAAALGLLVVAPILASSLQRRSEAQREDSSRVRGVMEDAARMMISDYPFGVGPNRYVLRANLGGYSERAGVPWNVGNRGAPVHNTYYLVTAEMGWLGLVAILWLFGSAILIALRALRRSPPSFGGEIAAGIAATFVVAAIHCYFEWIFMIHAGLTFFAMALGMVAALVAVAPKRGFERSASPQSSAAGAMLPA